MPSSATPSEAIAHTRLPFSIRDVAYLLFRYKGRAVLFAVTVILAATAAVWLMPPVYESDAKLLVRRGRETLALDPTVDSTKMTPVYTELMNDINSEIAILKSRELAEQIVKNLGPEKFLGPSSKVPAAAAEGVAVATLIEGIKVEAQEKSYIITIQYANRDPQLAQQVVARLIDLYLTKHISVFQTSGAYELFKEQSSHLRTALEKAETDLRNFKNLFGIASVDEQQKIVANRIRSIQEQTERTKTGLASSQARLQKLRQIQEGTATNNLLRPALITSDDYRHIQTDMMQEESSIAATTAQAEELNKFMADAQAELNRLNESAQRLHEMEREKALIEAQYQKYSESFEQARINRTIEGEKMSNIRIVQAASRPLTPKSAHKALRLLVAVLFAAMGGLGMALASEYMDHTFSRPEDIERVLRIPTMVSVPVLRDLDDESPHDPWKPSAKDQPQEISRAWQVPEDAAGIFETLRQRVLQQLKPSADGPVILGVTSCHLGEGASFVGKNLAITLARYAGDSQVLYVDASRYLRSRRENDTKLLGASELQSNEEGEVSVAERNLYAVPAAESTKNPSVPMKKTAKAYDRLLQLVRQRSYSFVVVDIPPLSEGIVSLRLGGPLDAMVLVIEAEHLRWEAAQWGLSLLREANVNILGAVLNKRHLYIPEWLYRRL